MKKIIYLVMITAVFFTSCDPMEDIYTDLNAEQQGNEDVYKIINDTELTLTDDDYDALDLSYGNFNSIDDAKTMIPGLLLDLYPRWGNLSSALVTFKWYSPRGTYSENIYELSDEDHNAITGSSYGNFDSGGDIYDYLEATYTSPEEGDFVSLRYRYYSGGESTLTNGFYYEGGNWNKIAGFTEEQYNAMGESFPNFSSHDEAETKMPIALLDVFKFDAKEAGDIVQAMYELYEGGGVTKSYTANFVFDGASWSKYNNEANETIQFGHDGTTWVPDNTIKYTLAPSDYELIGNALVDKYAGPAGSVSNYSNFDRRSGNNAYWSDEMLIEAFDILLDTLAPNAEEGQQYAVSFDIYNGSAGVETVSLIKADGVWVAN